MLTQKRLLEVLNYNPETGLFTWKVSRGSARCGDDAATSYRGGYLSIKIDKKNYYAHRIAWVYTYGEWPTGEVDHINRKRDDNRICNLQVVCKSENLQNYQKRKDSSSGVRGVTYNKKSGRWSARIQVNKNRIDLGLYNSKEEAISARRDAEKIYHPNKIKGDSRIIEEFC